MGKGKEQELDLMDVFYNAWDDVFVISVNSQISVRGN
jgi:hypothetical protein